MEENYKNKYIKYKNKYLILKSSADHHSIKQSGGGNKIDIMLFKAEWCGHCKLFKDTWEKLKENYNNKFNFITYDSVKDAMKIKTMGVKGYPTIMFRDNVLVKSYDGPRDYETLDSILSNLIKE